MRSEEYFMKSTKLGISVGLLGAAIYFISLFGGYTTTVLLVGYVLLFEENEWLKKSTVKAVALMVCFSLISALVNLLPDAVDFLSQVAGAFGGSFCITFIYHLATAADTMLRIVKKLLFICLGFKALNQGTIAVPAVDKLIGRFMR